MKDARNTQGRGRRRALLVAVAACAAWALGLLGAGCTSDPSDLVGAGLIETRIDSTLLELDIRTIDQFSGMRVDNDAVSIPQQQALYLGSEADARASALANFSIGSWDPVAYPDTLFTAANIKNVFFSLTRLNVYGGGPESITVCPSGPESCYEIEFAQSNGPEDTYYFVHELNNPFDPEAFTTYPAEVPAFIGAAINENFAAPTPGRVPRLKIYEDVFVAWINALGRDTVATTIDGVDTSYVAFVPDTVGIAMYLGESSDPGLLGLASGDLRQFSEIPAAAVGTIPGPNFIIEFEDGRTNLLIGPVADTTVWEEVSTPPADTAEAADGFMLRTGLRSYPAFQYTMANLPPAARINRAVLSVVNDTLTSYGPTMSIQISEIVPSLLEDPDRRFEVATMFDSTRIYPLSFASNKRPLHDGRIEFEVTAGLQRIINNVNNEVRGFILSGIEDKTIFRLSPDVTLPDVYYRQWSFHGLEDPDIENRPYLKVWYSVDEDLSGGGE